MKNFIANTNKSPEKLSKSVLRIVFDNCFSLFNLLNALIALALMLVGAWLNIAFLMIIILNAAIGITQELRAKKLVANLSLLTVPRAKIIRGGEEIEVPAENIALDDILILTAGGQVPADAVVLSGNAEVNESMLTGESESVLKSEGAEILSGSYLTGGSCRARVIRTGADKFISRLSREAKKHKKPSSELLNSMEKVTKFTSFFIIPIGVLLFAEAYFLRGGNIYDSVVFSAAALLGMLPKGLVLIMTIALFSGVIKLGKKKVLVQQLYSLETLARVDMLCLDKTGTLTEGKMRVSEVFWGQGLPLPPEELLRCFVSAIDDNNATLAALKERFTKISAPEVVSKVSFSSDKKWSGIHFKDLGTVILGAPEVLGLALPDAAKDSLKKGARVLCAGFSPAPLNKTIPENLVFAAALTLADPVRKNAKKTLDYFVREGVTLKIISGDNPLTVSAAAKEAGLTDYENFVDMSAVAPEAVAEAAVKYTIFGRVSPAQKKALVAALKAAGHTVAMTGDGVNDLPALREADCGIALAGGSDAARQVAELVLTENDFSALPEILIEGRRVMNNITRMAGVFFIKTIYSLLLSLICIAANLSFPFIPLQITLMDAAVEAYPGFFLSFEPDKTRVQGRFLPTVLKRAAPYAFLITLAAFAVPLFAGLAGVPIKDALTAVYYITGFVSLLSLFRSSSPLNGFRLFLCATATLGFFGAAMLFGSYLGLAPLSIPILIAFVASAAVVTLLLFPLKKLVEKLTK